MSNVFTNVRKYVATRLEHSRENKYAVPGPLLADHASYYFIIFRRVKFLGSFFIAYSGYWPSCYFPTRNPCMLYTTRLCIDHKKNLRRRDVVNSTPSSFTTRLDSP